jgi:hypothetical protein
VLVAKDLLRPVPGIRLLSQLRQRRRFSGSVDYWKARYVEGGNSGQGSYGELGRAKAAFLNGFVHSYNVDSVIEFGCGDGHQLSLANYPSYVGLDVSRIAVGLCKSRFAEDPTKSFFLYESASFVDRMGLFTADLAISLDVVYHLVEDGIFETHMQHLFGAGERYVIIYSTNEVVKNTAPHVRHRNFSKWVENHQPQWRLTEVIQGPDSLPGRADFYIYDRGNNDTCSR